MEGNGYAYSVKGLLIPKRGARDTLVEDMREYVNIIPTLTDKLKDNLDNERMSFFVSNLSTVIASLRKIYARSLISDAEAILRVASVKNIQKCKTMLIPFITGLHSLSIEIQMNGTNKQSRIEKYTDIVNNVSAIGYYVQNEEYDTAYEMLGDMEDLEGDDVAVRLKEWIGLGEQEKAGKGVMDLKNQYIQKIVDLGGSGNHFRKTILMVDDRPDILKTVSGILGEYYKVHGVISGRIALNFLEKHKPDLFLLDIEMPVMNGYELAKKIRMKKEHKKTPILFLTGNSTKDHVVEALRCGADDFIVKPAKADMLVAKVGKYLL